MQLSEKSINFLKEKGLWGDEADAEAIAQVVEMVNAETAMNPDEIVKCFGYILLAGEKLNSK